MVTINLVTYDEYYSKSLTLEIMIHFMFNFKIHMIIEIKFAICKYI